MKKAVVVAFAALLTAAMAQKFSVEAGAGLYGNLGGQLAVVAEDFTPGLPLGVRLGVGFAQSDALDDGYDLGGGTTWGDYKKTNELSEWGQNITLSLDVLYKVAGLGLPVEVAPYAGIRYNLFSGGYTDPQNKISGTKSESVSTNQFGFGAGVRLAYPLMPNLSLVGDLGADYYLNACFKRVVEDDSGNKNEGTVCPGDSGYDSRNERVTQPEWVFKLRVGAAYRF
ncbi:outer membrane beta-barrel protein [Thermus hydrothermalis]|uniref:outer membrane beta-barrel protein n=1 Tax=Thermus hydrothermalis TaxID=2908148 RepID=UPI001FAA7748|nr:outer membrane beta-barrel protein [Thermus hydrothermalis]